MKQPDIPAGPEADDEPGWPVAWPAAGEPFGPPAGPAGPFRHLSAGPPDQPPGGGDQPAERRRPVPLRRWLTIAAALLGGAGLAIALFGVAAQVMPRRFSLAEQQQIRSWEVASRWRTWPAGKIFPAAVSYQLSGLPFGTAGLRPSARRVGIAPQSGCTAAVDPVLAQMLARRGCEAVLRATYTDSTGSFVVTVGVVILPGTAPAAGSLPAGPGHGLPPGLRPVPFAGTVAARFGARQRQMSGAVSSGPYLVLFTAGYTDGRQRARGLSNPYDNGEMQDVGSGLAHSVSRALGALPPAPRCPGAPGC